MVLVIMDNFKKQDHDAITNLWAQNHCVEKQFARNISRVTTPHILTKKFQLLNIKVNKAAECFITEKFNKYFLIDKTTRQS